MKRVKWFLLFSVMLYIILLIPFDDRKHVNFDIEQPQRPVFSWGQNAYWQTLEAQYVELKQQGCNKAEVALTSNFEKLKKLIKRASVESLAPGHPIFKQLETLVFETGPVVSVCETSVMEYIKLIADMRAVIKQQSINWNIRSHATRTTLYRLLYGSRAAAEETILQSRSDLVLSLVHGTDEPSKAPYADLHDVRLRSGDILVSRGGAATSALIARGNNYPGNFSHIALVYIESDTQTPYIIEAHIEQGVVVSTAEQYLKDKKLRIMLLRPRADLGPLVADAMIPHKAAKYAYNRAI
ncbi:MAG: YiiX/YebB-like N1pC/P60 family cysteine hydrolase, partial [Gammaproteobacteria bacterium]|nr:YiiX/YebB-like N1pC/P60 family cysteine hydrolase [Gammaproteobacteria bacterium]